MTEFGDRNKMVDLLQEASQRDRMVIEFQKRGGQIQAMDITDHVRILEEQQEENDER